MNENNSLLPQSSPVNENIDSNKEVTLLRRLPGTATDCITGLSNTRIPAVLICAMVNWFKATVSALLPAAISVFKSATSLTPRIYRALLIRGGVRLELITTELKEAFASEPGESAKGLSKEPIVPCSAWSETLGAVTTP